MPVCSKLSKLGDDTVSRYGPTGSKGTVKLPSGPETTVRNRPVSVSVAVTAALGITACVLSSTTPVMLLTTELVCPTATGTSPTDATSATLEKAQMDRKEACAVPRIFTNR